MCTGSFKGTALQHPWSVRGRLHVPVTQELGQPVATKEGSIRVLTLSRRPLETSFLPLPRWGFIEGISSRIS